MNKIETRRQVELMSGLTSFEAKIPNTTQSVMFKVGNFITLINYESNKINLINKIIWIIPGKIIILDLPITRTQ